MKKFVVVLVLALAGIVMARPSFEYNNSARPNEVAVESPIDREAYQRCVGPFLSAAQDVLRTFDVNSFNPNKHYLCFSKALGWQNADGLINRRNIEASVDNVLSYSKAQQFKDECIITKATPELTAGHLFVCAKNYIDQQRLLN